jgi:DNA adenine methylase
VDCQGGLSLAKGACVRDCSEVLTNAAETREVRPPLKWAGGKRWLVPRLRRLWDEDRDQRLVEPFCGGLAVALGLAPRNALLNDANIHAVNFYRNAQRGLHLHFQPRNDRNEYYLRREQLNGLIANDSADSPEAAALFYYLNRTCYNGLCRFNKKGMFNVPFGKYKQIHYRMSFPDLEEACEGWVFQNGDFEELSIDKSDFVYADPPYDVEFTQYAENAFQWNDQLRLAGWLSSLEVPVVVSNQATARILELYGDLGFDVRCLPAPRRISCNGDRSDQLEMLAFKNVATEYIDRFDT